MGCFLWERAGGPTDDTAACRGSWVTDCLEGARDVASARAPNRRRAGDAGPRVSASLSAWMQGYRVGARGIWKASPSSSRRPASASWPCPRCRRRFPRSRPSLPAGSRLFLVASWLPPCASFATVREPTPQATSVRHASARRATSGWIAPPARSLHQRRRIRARWRDQPQRDDSDHPGNRGTGLPPDHPCDQDALDRPNLSKPGCQR